MMLKMTHRQKSKQTNYMILHFKNATSSIVLIQVLQPFFCPTVKCVLKVLARNLFRVAKSCIQKMLYRFGFDDPKH